mmetsp:Transcript_35182/g.39939  ORF Transcript_35182/g.39939 Transcript_35182/m.39939 type:complete len:453 (-) Transcript_35182:350-1708(-)
MSARLRSGRNPESSKKDAQSELPTKTAKESPFRKGSPASIKSQQFIDRPSPFDYEDPRSMIARSEFKGLFILIICISCIAIIAHPLVHQLQRGFAFKDHLFQKAMIDMPYVIGLWPLFTMWCFWAFLMQKTIFRFNLPFWLVISVQHCFHLAMVVVSYYIIENYNWPASHTAFMIVQSLVHFMKMHAYMVTNREYRQEYLESLANGTECPNNYPKNINIKDFFLFLAYPTFVYRDNYPRRETFRFGYFIRRALFAMLMLVAMYIVFSELMVPEWNKCRSVPFPEQFFSLILPCAVWVFLFFLFLWEGYLNCVAELTYFADREFYQDWWNSTTFGEFSRKWNTLVHNFLYRYAYIEFRHYYQWSSQNAQILTFLCSAICHELVIAIVLKMIRPYMFFFMLFQPPLVLFGRLMKGSAFGNAFFWMSLLVGCPLLATMYTREHCILGDVNYEAVY